MWALSHWNYFFFSLSTSVLSCQYHSTNAPYSSCVLTRTKGRSLWTSKKKKKKLSNALSEIWENWLENALQVHWFRQLFAGFSTRRLGFDTGSVRVVFVVGSLTVRQVCLAVQRSCPVSIILSMACTDCNVNTVLRLANEVCEPSNKEIPFRISRKIEYQVGFKLFTGRSTDCTSVCRRKIPRSEKRVSVFLFPSPSVWNWGDVSVPYWTTCF